MKTFEITKEQILELANESSFTKATLNKMFPQAFECELEVGKWYKSNLYGKKLYYFTEFKQADGYIKRYYYGFSDDLFKKDYTASTNLDNSWTLATDKEVETALIAEAKRRGFNKTTMITQTFNKNEKMCIGFWDESSVEFTRNKLFAKGVRIFDNGKWAEIISEPLTLEQRIERIEEQLKINK